jgi:hypothetical protein
MDDFFAALEQPASDVMQARPSAPPPPPPKPAHVFGPPVPPGESLLHREGPLKSIHTSALSARWVYIFPAGHAFPRIALNPGS